MMTYELKPNEQMIMNEWYNDSMLSSLILRQQNGVYELCEVFNSDGINYHNVVISTSDMDAMNRYIALAKQYMKDIERFISINDYEKIIDEKNDLKFKITKSHNQFVVRILNKDNEPMGSKHGEFCSFPAYVCLGKLAIHGSALIRKELRGQGYARHMYDLMEKNSGYTIVPHGYPLEINLTSDGRNFWIKRSQHMKVSPYNKEDYMLFQDAILLNKKTEYGTFMPETGEPLDQDKLGLAQLIMIASSENRDITHIITKDGRSIFTCYPENIDAENIQSAEIIDINTLIERIQNDSPEFIEDFDYYVEQICNAKDLDKDFKRYLETNLDETINFVQNQPSHPKM